MDTIKFKNTASGLKDILTEEETKKVIKKIPINLIKLNPLNDMDDSDEYIKEFAMKLQNTKGGIMDTITVYENVKGEYVLLSGECRIRAAKLNLQNNIVAAQTSVMAMIVEPPKTRIEELDLLLIYNEYRRFEDDEKKIKHVKKYNDLYELKIEAGEALGKRREWIARRSGIGIKKVGKILQYLRGEIDNVSTVDKKREGSKLDNVKNTQTTNKQEYRELENGLRNILETKVTIDNNKISISHNGNNDINRILDILGLINKLYDNNF